MRKYLMIISFFSLIAFPAFSQNRPEASKSPLLSIISSQVDQYNGKEIILFLRLRNIDYTMEKIVFYDAQNTDIVFDITGYRKNKVLLAALDDAHEGVLYTVSCVITGVGQDGLVTGRLVSFTPEFLKRIP